MERRNFLDSLLSICILSPVARLRGEPSAGQGGTQEHANIPAFHLRPPVSNGFLPWTLRPGLFTDPTARAAYALAAKIRPVLYQQPCYCYCDRSVGHQSLLDCYVGKHASECNGCQKEAIYAYGLTLAGKSPAEIREGIVRQEWKNVDLSVATAFTKL